MTALFTPTSVKAGIPVVLSSIFAVPVAAGDGLSLHACRNCVASACSLHEKLKKLRAMADKSYREVQSASGTSRIILN